MALGLGQPNAKYETAAAAPMNSLSSRGQLKLLVRLALYRLKPLNVSNQSF